jgi:hypothetical protein
VLLTNGLVTFALLSAPIRVHHDQQLLYETMRSAPPPFSYWKELIATPWFLIIATALILGGIAEVRRNVVSPIFNVGPYAAWLVVALWQRVKVAAEATAQDLFLGKMLLVLPLVVVVAVDLFLYVTAFRRHQTGAGYTPC